MKTCIKCNNQKPIQDFPTYKSRTPGTQLLHKNYCKTCRNGYTIIQCACGKPKHKKSELCEDCRKQAHIKDHKICPACKIEKPYTAYHMRKEKGGYSAPKSYCKECCKAKRKIQVGVEKNGTSTCECGNVKDGRSIQCTNCNLKTRQKDHTLEEALYLKGTKGSIYSLIRSRARNNIKVTSCEKCGYFLHVEVCHIKPINKFIASDKISDINHPDNLVVLCRNCHWEFDHGLLTLDQIKNCGLRDSNPQPKNSRPQ